MVSQICIYPLSPTYLPLHRYLYYLTLLLSVLYPRPPPLIQGCFAYALTYSSTAALYSLLLVLLPSADPIINLDIFGLWAILSVAGILLLPLLTWSRSLRRAGRPIIRFWGILVAVGAITSFLLLSRAKDTAGGFIAGGSGAASTVTCRAIDVPVKRLRDPEMAETADYDRLFGYWFGLMYYRLSPLVHVFLSFGAFSSLISSSPSTPRPFPSKSFTLTSTTTQPSIFNSIETPKPQLSFLITAFQSLCSLTLFLTPAFLISVMVVNEIYLLKDWPVALPEAEKIYEVGQWGLYAGVALVSVAAGINLVVSGQNRDGNERTETISSSSWDYRQARGREKNWGWGGEGAIA